MRSKSAFISRGSTETARNIGTRFKYSRGEIADDRFTIKINEYDDVIEPTIKLITTNVLIKRKRGDITDNFSALLVPDTTEIRFYFIYIYTYD